MELPEQAANEGISPSEEIGSECEPQAAGLAAAAVVELRRRHEGVRRPEGTTLLKPEYVKFGFPHIALKRRFERSDNSAAPAPSPKNPKLAHMSESQLRSAVITKTSFHSQAGIFRNAWQEAQMAMRHDTLHFERALALFAGIGS